MHVCSYSKCTLHVRECKISAHCIVTVSANCMCVSVATVSAHSVYVCVCL